MAKVIVTGGTGFLGTMIIAELVKRDYEVIVFTRSAQQKNLNSGNVHYVKWNPVSADDVLDEWLNKAEAVIHLAGAPVAKRWTKNYKKTIVDSRTISTRKISESINRISNPPKFFFSASAVGIYGNADDALCTESSEIISSDFLSHVCQEWETAAKVSELRTRLVIGRIGIILDKSEGALSKMLPSFKFGLGAILGTGNQWWSWIHVADAVSMILWAMENESVRGTVNIVSPAPVTMRTFARLLGKCLHKPVLFKAPSFLLNFVMGQNAVIVTASQRVSPQYAQQKGYQFRFPDLEEALNNILDK